MARRVTAVVGIILIVGLLIVLIWRVYLHHESRVPAEEPAVVSIFTDNPVNA
jgi:succinate dehydrogenase hydrophobic anchor subunit